MPPLRPSPLTLSLPLGCLLLQLAVGILLGVAFGTYNTTNLPDSITYVALVLICIFVAGEAGCAGNVGNASAQASAELERQLATCSRVSLLPHSTCRQTLSAPLHRRLRLVVGPPGLAGALRGAAAGDALCWLLPHRLHQLREWPAGLQSLAAFRGGCLQSQAGECIELDQGHLVWPGL